MKTAGNNRKTTSNRVALYGLLIALAFVLSYVETLFPVYLGAPGVKPVSYTHLTLPTIA